MNTSDQSEVQGTEAAENRYDPALEAQYYLIGRLLLDGAAPADLAARFGIAREAVDEAWRVSSEQLSLDIAFRDSAPFRLRSFDELNQESRHCVRRLIEWRERLLPSPAASTTAATADEGTTDSADGK